jgi:hypothetical protein
MKRCALHTLLLASLLTGFSTVQSVPDAVAGCTCPQDIQTRALPTDPMMPKARISGRINFHADNHALTQLTRNVDKKVTSKSAVSYIIFPFKVVK